MALFRRRDRPAQPAPADNRGVGLRAQPPVAAPGPARSVSDSRCAPAVGTDWMQAQTLRETGTQLPLKGTSFYQSDIASLAWACWDGRPPTDLLTVQLAVVPTGQWAGAVGVYAAGVRVASIPADLAEPYRAVVTDLADAGLPAMCRATVVGGHARDARGADALRFGLALVGPTRPARADTEQPFLPPVIGYQADVPEQLARELDASLPSRAKNYIRRTVGHVDLDDESLVVDGRRLGRLGVDWPDGTDRLEAVRAAAAAGHPTTCLVRMIRAPGRTLRVMADLPMVSHGPQTGLSFDLL